MNLSINEYAQAPSGLFILNVYRNGDLIERVEEKNLIVNNSKPIHANLLGGNFTNNNVTRIGFGTNGTAPTAGDTALTGAYVKALDSVTYPVSGSVQFNFSLYPATIDPGSVGLAILEFGLLTPTTVLYARKVRSAALNVNTDLSFSGSWTITF